MGIQCQILINKTKQGVYIAGQAVTGKVRYLIDEPTEYQHVTLSLLGKGKCIWTRGGKYRRRYRGEEYYIITHINVCNKKPEDTVTLEGKYEHPFEFFLPENIPSTHKDNIASISYQIQLKFEKPSFFSFTKVFTAEIPVFSFINPTLDGPIYFGLDKELFAPFTSKTPVVKLKAKIEESFLAPGESAHISYIVTNDSDVKVTSVTTSLHCYTTYTADNGTKRHFATKIEPCEAQTVSILARQEARFSCVLPTLTSLFSIPNSKVICIEYRVRATVKLPLPHLNATVEQPVLIGEVKGGVERAVEAMEDEDRPPTYWEAMNEGQKKEKSDDESD